MRLTRRCSEPAPPFTPLSFFDVPHLVGCGIVSPDAIENAIGLSERFYGHSHDAVIRVYDAAGNVIETHEHKSDFKDW